MIAYFSKIRYYLILLVLVHIFSCSQKKAKYNIDHANLKAHILTNWRVVGPFKHYSKKSILETDYLLERYGLGEESINENQFSNLKAFNDTSNIINKLIDTVKTKLSFNSLFGLKPDSSITGAAYASCTIQSSKEVDFRLNFASSDSVKIWLNNKHVSFTQEGTDMLPYENYIPIHLKKGDNFLLIKISNRNGPWEMFAGIEKYSKASEKRHNVNMEMRYGNHFMSRNIIDTTIVKLNWGIPADNYRLSLKGPRDTSFLIKVGQDVNIATLPEGFYSATLYSKTDTFSSRLYKANNALQKISAIVNKISASKKLVRDSTLSGLLHRYSILIQKENLPTAGYQWPNWDKRVLFVLDNLLKRSKAIEGEIDARDLTGCLMKSYVSKIDGGTQYYILHVPDSYKKGTNIPLVVEMSKLMKWFPSQVETNRFANIRLIEHFDDLANRFNMVIVEPGNRTVDKSNYNNIDQADFWEMLEDVKKHYSIDTGRIFLRGSCRASYDVLKLAVRYPDKFAAISTLAPELVSMNASNNIWIHHNMALNFMDNIRDMPYYSLHSPLDPHSPFKASRQINEVVKKAKFKYYTFRSLPMEFKTYYTEEYLDDIFRFFSKVSTKTQPKEVSFSTDRLTYNKSFWFTIDAKSSGKTSKIEARLSGDSLTVTRSNVLGYTINLAELPYNKRHSLVILDNGKKRIVPPTKGHFVSVNISNEQSKKKLNKTSHVDGPFGDIFTRPFIVVSGTGGNQDDRAAGKRIIKFLNDKWQNRYYSNFRMKEDVNITDIDIKNYNLLLIGSANSNGLISKAFKRLPFSIDSTSIKIGQHSLKGTNLNYYVIYPNPDNPKRYVAILGYLNPRKFSIMEESSEQQALTDISNYGWYDFKIWNGIGGKSISGYFDEQWK